MPTINAIDSNIPIEIARGGMGVTSFATSLGIVKYDGTVPVTSSTYQISATNQETNTSQPCFLAIASPVSNVTGDGTAYTVIFDTEIYDVGGNYNNATGVFTAPVTGKYLFHFSVGVSGITNAETLGYYDLVTTKRSYRTNYGNHWTTCVAASDEASEAIILADMDASDTAYVVVTMSNGTKIVDIQADTEYNRFCGNLIC